MVSYIRANLSWRQYADSVGDGTKQASNRAKDSSWDIVETFMDKR